MSAKGEKQKPAAKDGKKAFECADEAEALLKCVVDKKYNEMKCLPLLKKLRACVEKEVSDDQAVVL